MYLSMNMQTLQILHKHPSMNCVFNLVYLEYPTQPCRICDVDLALKNRSELELKLMYRNLSGKEDIPSDYKEQVLELVSMIPITDVDTAEVARLAATVGPHDKKKYHYVKGQFSSFFNQPVFDDTPRNMEFVKSERTGIFMPTYSQEATAKRMARDNVVKAPKEPKEPRAPKEPGEASSRPKAGSSTGKVWDIADEIAVSITDEKALRKSVIDKCVQEGINKSTASVQFGKWRNSR